MRVVWNNAFVERAKSRSRKWRLERVREIEHNSANHIKTLPSTLGSFPLQYESPWSSRPAEGIIMVWLGVSVKTTCGVCV